MSEALPSTTVKSLPSAGTAAEIVQMTRQALTEGMLKAEQKGEKAGRAAERAAARQALDAALAAQKAAHDEERDRIRALEYERGHHAAMAKSWRFIAGGAGGMLLLISAVYATISVNQLIALKEGAAVGRMESQNREIGQMLRDR